MNTATITSSSFLQRWTQDAHIFESAHYSHSFTSHTHLGMCVEHYGVLALSGFARCSHLLSISRVDSIEEVKEKIQSRPLLDILILLSPLPPLPPSPLLPLHPSPRPSPSNIYITFRLTHITYPPSAACDCSG